MDQTDFSTPGCLPKPRVHHLIPRDASDRDRDDTQSVALFLRTTGPPSRPADKPVRRRSMSSRPPKRLVKRSSARKQHGFLHNSTSSKDTTPPQSRNVVECVSESGARFFQIIPKEFAENIDVMPDCELVNFSYNSTARASLDIPRRHLSSASSLRPASSARPQPLYRNRLVADSKDLDSFAEAIDETNARKEIDEGMPDTASLLRRPFSRQDKVDAIKAKIQNEHITKLGNHGTPNAQEANSTQAARDRHLLAISSNARVHTPLHFNGGVTDARAALRSNPIKAAPDRPLPDLPENKRLSTGSRSQHIDEALETLRKSSMRISASLQEAKMDKASNQGRRRVSRDMYQVAGPLLYSGTTKASLSSHASSTDSTANDHYFHSTMDATDSFSRHLAEISKPRTSFTPRYSSLKRTGGFPDLSGQHIGRYRPANNGQTSSPSSSSRLPSLTESNSTVPAAGHARVNSNSSDIALKSPHRREKYEKARARKLKDLHKSRPSIDRVVNAANGYTGRDSSEAANDSARPSVDSSEQVATAVRPIANTHEKLDVITHGNKPRTQKLLQSIWNTNSGPSSQDLTMSGALVHDDKKTGVEKPPSTPQIDVQQSQSRFSNSTATTGYSPATQLTSPVVYVDAPDAEPSDNRIPANDKSHVRQGLYMRDMTQNAPTQDYQGSQQQPHSTADNRLSLAQSFPGGLTPSPSMPLFHMSHSHLSHLISESSFDPNPFSEDGTDTMQTFPSFTTVTTQSSSTEGRLPNTESTDSAVPQSGSVKSIDTEEARTNQSITPQSSVISPAVAAKPLPTLSSRMAAPMTAKATASTSFPAKSNATAVALPLSSSNSAVAPIFSTQSRLEARIDLLERENKLLEAALMAVLKTSGKLNGCLCGGACPGSLNKSTSFASLSTRQPGQSLQAIEDGQGALGMYLRSRRGGSIGALTSSMQDASAEQSASTGVSDADEKETDAGIRETTALDTGSRAVVSRIPASVSFSYGNLADDQEATISETSAQQALTMPTAPTSHEGAAPWSDAATNREAFIKVATSPNAERKDDVNISKQTSKAGEPGMSPVQAHVLKQA